MQHLLSLRQLHISAHVRILYEGAPEQFAWLLPMPNVPDLALSNSSIFGLIDRQTAPVINPTTQNLCPQQRYACRQHPPCPSPRTAFADGSVANAAEFAGDFASEPSPTAASGPGGSPPPVQVLAQERIGSYDTVTFAADEAELAVEWLNDNGFIINETMSPYMQPYLDEGMVFVASKLVPGADVAEIRPLELTYISDTPAIPLRLTAIAAEPHMMVTAFIFADKEYEAAFHPKVELDTEALWGVPGVPRSNYPALLSRQIDEQGADAFIKEYSGAPPVWSDPTGCCPADGTIGNGDWCGVAGDGLCQCPGSDIDAADCASQEELTEAVAMAKRLNGEYARMTRLSTRLSPEEMYFDPEFQPAADTQDLRLTATSVRYAFDGCEPLVIDQDEHAAITARALCSSVYCDYGSCAITAAGAGCACDEGFVARTYTESDGTRSITCVPEVGRVDFAAGGAEVPDACEGVQLDNGTCVDIGGFAAVRCDEGLVAVVPSANSQTGPAAQCVEPTQEVEGPGATNYSAALKDLDACAQPPPQCPANGWLEEFPVTITGVDCGTTPDASWFEETPKPVCSMNTMNGASSALVATPASAPNDMMLDTTAPRPSSKSSGWCGLHAPGSTRSTSGLWLLALLVSAAGLRGRVAARRGQA